MLDLNHNLSLEACLHSSKPRRNVIRLNDRSLRSLFVVFDFAIESSSFTKQF